MADRPKYYPFMPVQLETMDGHRVVTALIPPFQSLPEVVSWGTRTFKLHADPQDSYAPIVYREVFAVAIVMTVDEYAGSADA